MKLDVLMHYEVDEKSGEIKFIGKEEIKVDTVDSPKKTTTTKKSTSTKTSKIEEDPNPIVTLEANKLVLTTGAVDKLQVCEDCRIDIKYKKKGKSTVPVIGTDKAFGTKAGNLLTKSNTVSFRGSANEKLAAYGDTFTLEPTEDEGIYYLIGNKVASVEVKDEEIKNIESELDIDLLDNLNIDSDDKNLDKFNFTL
jgi:hypothetical protein